MPCATNKGRGHEGKPNETTEAYFTPHGDGAHVIQRAHRRPRTNNFLHLKIMN